MSENDHSTSKVEKWLSGADEQERKQMMLLLMILTELRAINKKL